MILQVYTQHPEIISFIRYLCMMFVVYLPVSFMASLTNYRKTPLLPILRISDVHLMLHFSHINIVIALFMTIFLMLKTFREKVVDDGFRHTVIVAMSFAAAGVASDLARYLIKNGRLNDTSACTRIGVLIFVTLLGIHLIWKRTQLAVKKERAEIMEKLAYTDSLTGLSNRAAFHEKENEIRQQNTRCVIVQLDINHLKTRRLFRCRSHMICGVRSEDMRTLRCGTSCRSAYV